MKKTISYILLTAILVSLLSGCGKDEKETPPSNTKGTLAVGGANGQEGSVNSEIAQDDWAVKIPVIQDNSLDAYSAIINTPLGVENYSQILNTLGTKNPSDAIGRIKGTFLGASRAYFFAKNLFENADECWNELSFVTAEGKTGAQNFGHENLLWSAGPAAGTNHYITLDFEAGESEESYRYFLSERDENHKILREFPLNVLDGSSASEINIRFAVDYFGVAHVLWQRKNECQYLLVSPTGEILADYIPKNSSIRMLVPLYDGRVAFLETEQAHNAQNPQMTLQYMDAESGRPVLLAALEKESFYVTLFDENSLLYGDDEGISRSDLSGNHSELLYRWSNHGIAPQTVSAMQTDGDGQIGILYKDSENVNYLFLIPTTEEKELCEITLAVPFFKMSAYQPLVVEFNKMFPDYHIELKSDYDKTALLAELIAGKGPVLIDTFLTGFEEQEKLWEPLDMVVAKTGITEALHPIALESGKINGTLYGIVTDFTLHTLITGNTALTDWDYDTFLQCIEARPDLEAIFDYYGGNYGPYFIAHFFSHGMDDSYLLDVEAGTMNFDSSEFRRILALARQYCVREEGVKPGLSLLEGRVLCNVLNINKPEKLAAYRICYGEDANYIGYPTKDGAAHFIEGSSPLAIRRTATEEEKAAASAFISFCLSYEGQMQAAKGDNFGLSVRRDVLEEQISAMDEHTAVYAYGFDTFLLGNDLNIALDRQTLLDMIDAAKPMKYFPTALENIFYEELEQYFSDTITEDMLIDHLMNRVGLYLEERN